ncbi:sulfite exporter TauE/SafE family protein 3-like isoform X2 [Momordica charantia]|uniref:Sulfite exporter TauE/SafE family protein 3-like isoform X2 n=1 Tax=Momordica charantia TaxID=3673 RepID=A0A6J1C927_MOMCH|nr:sulfite exporter TauE/SafE family protein 3-like isoform X2 [Momordica charantia]
MADSGGGKWRSKRPLLIATVNFLLALAVVSAERSLKMPEMSSSDETRRSSADDRRDFKSLLAAAKTFLRRADGADNQLVWPDMEFGWRIVAGTAVGFMGGAFGSVGGLGGGAFFLPMLNLIIGFDPKSSTAISKCMIMGAAVSTVYYNLKLRHPALDMPIIDYDLVLLVQPMLMLGISIGVIFNVILADWMVTILLLILFLFISTKAFLKGVAAWKKETLLLKMEADKLFGESHGIEYRALPGGPGQETKEIEAEVEMSILQNVCWKELGLLFFVWVAFLVLQILKEKTMSCSWKYWLLNLLQIPVSVGVCSYEAINLYKGRRVISSLGDRRTEFRVGQLLAYGTLGVAAGTVAGLLGVGGGSIMGPLFLELGVPPQVASASATFAMMFSSSMSVVEYYLLDQFPVSYAVYFAAVATVAAYCGQHVVREIIALLGRASIIIFVLSFTLFFFSLTQGGVGISDAIQRIQRNEYMGFQNLCRSSG